MTSQSPFKFCIILYCHDKYVIFSPVNFKLIHVLLWIKGSHQSFNVETYECSGENLPIFSCHFWNHKTVFLQIFHYSVPSNVTHLYFFSSNIIYLGKSSPLKYKCLCFSSARVKICQILHVNFELASQLLFKFCIIAMTHNSPVNFKFMHYLLWRKGPIKVPI